MPARSHAEVSVADPPLRRPISASPLYLAILCGDLPACIWAAGAVVGGRYQPPTGVGRLVSSARRSVAYTC